jgi:hypothetical protein
MRTNIIADSWKPGGGVASTNNQKVAAQQQRIALEQQMEDNQRRKLEEKERERQEDQGRLEISSEGSRLYNQGKKVSQRQVSGYGPPFSQADEVYPLDVATSQARAIVSHESKSPFPSEPTPKDQMNRRKETQEKYRQELDRQIQYKKEQEAESRKNLHVANSSILKPPYGHVNQDTLNGQFVAPSDAREYAAGMTINHDRNSGRNQYANDLKDEYSPVKSQYREYSNPTQVRPQVVVDNWKPSGGVTPTRRQKAEAERHKMALDQQIEDNRRRKDEEKRRERMDDQRRLAASGYFGQGSRQQHSRLTSYEDSSSESAITPSIYPSNPTPSEIMNRRREMQQQYKKELDQQVQYNKGQSPQPHGQFFSPSRAMHNNEIEAFRPSIEENDRFHPTQGGKARVDCDEYQDYSSEHYEVPYQNFNSYPVDDPSDSMMPDPREYLDSSYPNAPVKSVTDKWKPSGSALLTNKQRAANNQQKMALEQQMEDNRRRKEEERRRERLENLQPRGFF